MTLPDNYDTRQGAALGAALEKAVETGDIRPALKIADHLVAESGVGRDNLMATILFKLSTDAMGRGDERAQKQHNDLMLELCSKQSIQDAIAGGLIQAGLREGLAAEHHDKLLELTADVDDPETLALIRKIERLP